MTQRKAKRAARRRFGSWRSSRMARQALGGDWKGLISLFLAYRVEASPWFQPMALIVTILLMQHDSAAVAR